MSFINELYIIDEMPSMNNRKSIFDNSLPGGIRHCEWLPITDLYSLSIQASEYHYCIPRALIPLEDYTHFEMALIFEDSISTDIIATTVTITIRQSTFTRSLLTE